MSKRNFSYASVLMMIISLFVISAGGCGGGSSSKSSSTSTTNTAAATKPVTVLKISSGMDADKNGKPDFLDFTGVPQYQLDSTTTAGSLAAASSIFEASELKVTVPAIVHLKELKLQSEDPNVVSVYFEAGKEYTIEFSKNFTDILGPVIPSIKIYDPKNAELADYEAEELTDVKISAYPAENPSIICYTIKAETSGNYSIKVCDVEPTANAVNDDEDEEDSSSSSTVEVDTSSVLFIYEERHNEEGDNGYYTKFKFEDVSGDVTKSSINIDEIIQMRKEFLMANPDYFKSTSSETSDDEYGSGETVSYKFRESNSYSRYLDRVQGRMGLVAVNEDNEGEGTEYGDGVESYSAAPSYTTDKQVTDDDIPYSQIPATLEGIPYDRTYTLGAGFSAITNLSPVGGMGMDSFLSKLKPKDDDDDDISVSTEYEATFVSTRSEAEHFSKATSSLSLAKNALGASLSTGSTNNYKFGLTSTTFVIHYEEVEDDYRQLTNRTYLKLADDEGIVDYAMNKKRTVEDFRNRYGDYFVAGYQYGACFDAYISITTETSEQIATVKNELSAKIKVGDFSASADVSKETKDTLKDCNANISIRIVTTGMGKSDVPTDIPVAKSKDIDGIDSVFTELAEFRNKLTRGTSRKNYAPVRVKLKRWRSLSDIADAFEDKGDIGYIPIPASHAANIQSFNRALVTLRAYRNTVMETAGMSGSTAAANLDKEFARIEGLVVNGGNAFYASATSIANTLKNVEELTDKFKALSDRYTFYRKLVNAQKAEKKTYDKLLKDSISAGRHSDAARKYVSTMPFGSEHGGSSGYDSFAVSSAVTEDIQLGKKVSRRYNRPWSLGWRYEWKYNQTKADGDDYLASAGPALLTATTTDGSEARFCKVWVNSVATSSQTDNARELESGSTPAVGKKEVGFYFMSGGTHDADWNIYGQSMRMRAADYPFDGLE